MLERVLAKGGSGFYDWIRHDSDMDAIRNTSRFQKLLAGVSNGDANRSLRS